MLFRTAKGCSPLNIKSHVNALKRQLICKYSLNSTVSKYHNRKLKHLGKVFQNCNTYTSKTTEIVLKIRFLTPYYQLDYFLFV